MSKLFRNFRFIFNLTSKRAVITSSYPKITIENKNFTNFTLDQMKQYSDRTFMIDSRNGIEYSYSDTINCVRSLSSYLNEKYRLQRGDRVAIISPNSPHYLIIILGVIACGAVPVPINTSYTPYELKGLLKIITPRLIFSNSHIIEGIQKEEKLNFIEDYLSLDGISSTSSKMTIGKIMEYSDRHCPLGDYLDEFCEEPALNVFSSGTTGLPKAVQLSHKNLISSNETLGAAKTFDRHSVTPGFLPFSHIYGIMISLMQPVRTGSAIIISPSFNMEQLINQIPKFKVNIMHIVPPIALYMLNHPKFRECDLSSVKKIFVGAAPLDKEVENRIIALFREQNPKFVIGQGYGLSETTGIISVMSYENLKSYEKHGSVGEIVANSQLKVLSLDEENKELGPNQVGHIYIKSTNVMLGYLGIDKDDPRSGWKGDFLSTGDIGYYDDDHFLFISDRIKELIKVKGFQVAPAELEGFLLTHEAVKDCAVIGVPHDVYGEVPRAFVVRRSDVSEAELQDYVEKNLSSTKQLRGGVKFIESIPKTASGKILRKNLKNIE